MADSEEAILLRRRARRRLVGAIALVVFAVIVLPIVFDKEPRPISQDIVIQIPSQNSGRFNTKVLPATAEPAKGTGGTPGTPDAAVVASIAPNRTPAQGAATALPPVVAPSAPKDAPAARVSEPAKAEAVPKSVEKKAAVFAKEGAQPAESAKSDPGASRAQGALQGDSYVVPLGAFLNQANVKALQAKVMVAGFKSYSEIQKVAKGEQIRVRAGPFSSRDAAERAREQLRAAGLTVGPVVKL